MEGTISAKELRASLPETVERVRRGERFTVLYRSRPAFRIVPVDDHEAGRLPPLAEDPIYRASAQGCSGDGAMARDHDAILYGWKRRARRARPRAVKLPRGVPDQAQVACRSRPHSRRVVVGPARAA